MKPFINSEDRTVNKIYKKYSYDFSKMAINKKGLRKKDVSRYAKVGNPSSPTPPVFSVCLCVHNDAGVLNRSISSVLNQTFSDWELLLLDDGSTDEMVWTMMENAMEMDARIHGIRGEENVGWAKGLSLCLNHATGKYITVLGAGDCLHPEALATVNEITLIHDPDVAWAGFSFVKPYKSDFHVLETFLSPFRVMKEENKVHNVIDALGTPGFHFLFHYLKLEFLREFHIDFFDAYYAGEASLTHAMANAKTMVVLDKLAYYVTSGSPHVKNYYIWDGYRTISLSQWNSLKNMLLEEGVFSETILRGFARMVGKNLFTYLRILCEGGECRDAYLHSIIKQPAERFQEIEDALSQPEIVEIMEFYGRDDFFKEVKAVLDRFLATYDETSGLNPYKSSKWLKTIVRYTYSEKKSRYFLPVIQALQHPRNKAMFGMDRFLQDVRTRMGNAAFDRNLAYMEQLMETYGRRSVKWLRGVMEDYITQGRLKMEHYQDFHRFFLQIYGRMTETLKKDKELARMKERIEEYGS